ncbi:MAG TPA: lytic transglycosylase domain-containing protein [Burkholderiales bacterium]|nr:lytic transglycosylase domain-containing protein [Burkholderiales bacterium]
MKFRLFLLLVSALSAGIAHADIYRYVDADGAVHFTNVPQDSRYKIYLKEKKKAPDPVTNTLASEIRHYDEKDRARYARTIQEVARATRLEPALIHAVISAESGYNPFARSRKGAAGLMQLMPETARRYGVTNRLDPAQNIRGGARYLRDLIRMFNNDLQLAIAAYNAGENAVVRAGNRIPPYAETMTYVPRVMTYYRKYRAMS